MVFGRWRAIRRAPSHKTPSSSLSMWLCECSCGIRREVTTGSLVNGTSKSCGCLNAELSRERARKSHTTHGLYYTSEHRSWTGMKTRCLNKNNPKYPYYGGRGIKICPAWMSFDKFFRDMGPKPAKYLTIERKDVNGDYCPENCCWATNKVQQNNKRSNRAITHNGTTLNLSEWASRTEIHHNTIDNRLKRGWSIQEALMKPPLPRGPYH